MFKLNPEQLGSCIAVPDGILRDHLKLASGAGFKVLLCVLRGACTDAAQIAGETGLSESAVTDALDYWLKSGVLLCDEKQPATESVSRAQAQKAPEKEVAKPAVSSRPLPLKYPTHSEIAARCAQSPEIAFVLSESQKVLGNTCGYNTQALLVLMHDHYGFTADVILMLLQHAKLTGKTAGASLRSLSESWAKRGVASLSDAEREIQIYNKQDEVFTELNSKLGFASSSPNDTQRAYLYTWLYTFEFNTDIIAEALNAVKGEGAGYSFASAGKLLRKWYDKGYNDVESVRQKTVRAKSSSAGRKTKPSVQPSYSSGKPRHILYEQIKAMEGGEDE